MQGVARLAGGAATGLQLDRGMLQMVLQALVARQQTKRGMQLLIGLKVIGVISRQPADVGQAADVARRKPCLPPKSLIERVLPAHLHDFKKTLVLQSLDLFTWPAVHGLRKHVWQGITLVERIPIERVAVGWQQTATGGW